MTASGWRLLALCLGAVMVCHPARASAARLLFVSNFGDDTVSVIDRDLDREIEVIAVGRAPLGIALRQHEPLVAVANSKARSATLIDPIRLEALPNNVPTGMGPEDVVFSADGRQLIATSYYDKTVTFTDLASRVLSGQPIAFASIPRRLLLSPDGAELFVLLHGNEGAVAVVDLASHQVLTTIPVGPFPSGFAFTPDGMRLLAASFDASTMTVIDPRTRAVVDTFSLDTGPGFIVHPTRPVLYSMLSFDGEVLAFDYTAHQPLATIAVGGSPSAGAITADGRVLYVVSGDANNVVKVDTETNAAVLRIAVGTDPQAAVLFDTSPTIRSLWLVTAAAALLGATLGVRWWRHRAAPRPVAG